MFFWYTKKNYNILSIPIIVKSLKEDFSEHPRDLFSSIFNRRDNPDYEKLVQKVGESWKRLWFEYRAWYEAPVKYTQKSREGKLRKNQPKIRLGPSHYKGEHLVRFLEYVIRDHEDTEFQWTDRLILIFLTSRLRDGLRETFDLFGPNSRDGRGADDNLGLCWLLLQWRDQVSSVTEEDALTTALIRLEAPPEEIAWAEVGHARRLRAGIGSPRLQFSRQVGRANVELKKIEISTRLLRNAEAIFPGQEKLKDIEQFCYIPTNSFHSYIELQHALNYSRTGNQRMAAKQAEKLLEDFKNNESTTPNYHTDSYLSWWCYHILIRASSASLDKSRFSEYKKQMHLLEDSLEGNFKEYFRAYHSIGYWEDGLPSQPPKWQGRMVREENEHFKKTKQYHLIEALRNWKRFYGSRFYDSEGVEDEDPPVWPDCEELRKKDGYRAKYFRGRDRPKEWEDFLGTAGKPQIEFLGFHAFHNIAHEGSDGRTFQRLTTTLGTEQAFRKRISRMIKEVDEARFACLRRMDAYTCVMLEILGRALVYRFWFEVIKTTRRTEEKWKMSHLSNQIGRSIRVLERIKHGIESSRAFEGDEDDIGFIDEFIKIFRGMLDNKDNIKTGLDSRSFGDEVRREMNRQDELGREKYPDQNSFLGIPWADPGESMMRVQHSFVERARPSS